MKFLEDSEPERLSTILYRKVAPSHGGDLQGMDSRTKLPESA